MKAFQANIAMVESTVDKYADMLIRIAFQNTRNYSDAEDIVQEVLTKLFVSSDTISDEAHLKAWLIRVTINRCHDLARSPWHKRKVEMPPDYPDYTDSEKGILNEVLALPEKYRNVIYLYYFEGYKLHEIADILSENINTVGSQLQRGRTILKSCLEGDDHHASAL